MSSLSQTTYKWKIIGLSWAGLYEELVPPCIKGLKGFGIVDVVYKHAAVGSTVKGNP